MDSKRKPRVLVLTSYYFPGYRAGGPIRSVANLVAALADEIDFHILTRDRDLGEGRPYADVLPDVWVTVEKARVRYLGGGRMTLADVRETVHEVEPDLLYLNSLFDPEFTIRPLSLRRFGFAFDDVPVLIAPRGELFPGALALKSLKKRCYLLGALWLDLYRDVCWQASSAEERELIRERFGTDTHVMVAPNLPTRIPSGRSAENVFDKSRRRARFVYVGRIARNKNLKGTLEALADVDGDAELTIFGSIEDRAYWTECERDIRRLPRNVSVRYGGELRSDDVALELAHHDYFLSMTHGENYGHAIVEALSSGLPVLVSDRTPWRDLEERDAGWALPLHDRARIRRAVQACIDSSPDEYARRSEAAQNYAENKTREPAVLEQSRQLFRAAVGMGYGRRHFSRSTD